VGAVLDLTKKGRPFESPHDDLPLPKRFFTIEPMS
jgi:hypothetical protein